MPYRNANRIQPKNGGINVMRPGYSCLGIALFIQSLATITSANGTETLTITVENIKNTHGVVLVSLYDSDEKFLEKPLAERTAKIEADKKTTVSFQNIPPGTYAFTIIHDENENGDIDLSILGIPKEAYAFSNNAEAVFAPPKYDDAKFRLSAGQSEYRVSFP